MCFPLRNSSPHRIFLQYRRRIRTVSPSRPTAGIANVRSGSAVAVGAPDQTPAGGVENRRSDRFFLAHQSAGAAEGMVGSTEAAMNSETQWILWPRNVP